MAPGSILRSPAAAAVAVVVALTHAPSAAAAPASAWRNRTVYQLLTDRYNAPGSPACNDLSVTCGGSFTGILDQLDYIQSAGFDAVWELDFWGRIRRNVEAADAVGGRVRTDLLDGFRLSCAEALVRRPFAVARVSSSVG